MRKLVSESRYEFSRHAERERELDMIFVDEFEDAMKNCEIIEHYPDDPRGASCLVIGFSGQRPIHVVCAIRTDPEELFLITLYDPSKRPDNWSKDYKKRR
ncbi:MAG TPA: DUF4258 domain-containing protein [Candidatus Brocadiales bacterium]|nr:DUF4258 domain-containing protein [Candidatus Brocadiales bacterium]